jgi:natural product precursor
MKKLNLQLGSIKEMLTKEQMKKVAGGYDWNIQCKVINETGTHFYVCDTWNYSDVSDVITAESDCDNLCEDQYGTGCFGCTAGNTW